MIPLPSAIQPAAPVSQSPELLARRTFRAVDVVLILGCFGFLELVLAPGFARGVFDLANRSGLAMARFPLPVMIQIIAQEMPILLVIGILTVLRGLSWGDLGFRRTAPWMLLLGIGLVVVLLPIRLCVGIAAQVLVGGSLQDISRVDVGRTFPLMGRPALAGLPIVLLVGVLAPLVEELIFRTALYGWLRQRIGMVGGIVISSLVFGVAHGQVAMGASAFVMGLALAWLYEQSRSLWVPLFLHILNNSALFLLIYGLLGLQELLRLPLR